MREIISNEKVGFTNVTEEKWLANGICFHLISEKYLEAFLKPFQTILSRKNLFS